MRTCSLKSVYQTLLRKRGFEPEDADIPEDLRLSLEMILNQRLSQGWTSAMWPETIRVEQREYRATYDATETYSTDDEVFYENDDGDKAYYRSLQDDNTGNDPDTETAYWEADPDDFRCSIDYEQTGETAIGHVDARACLFENDPRLYDKLHALWPVELIGDEIVLTADDTPLQPWVKFQARGPQISLHDWSTARTYAIGDLVYVSSEGASYKALAASSNQNPVTATSYWSQVEVPLFLRDFLIKAASADMIEEDEQRQQAQGTANRILARLQDVYVNSAGIERRLNIRVM